MNLVLIESFKPFFNGFKKFGLCKGFHLSDVTSKSCKTKLSQYTTNIETQNKNIKNASPISLYYFEFHNNVNESCQCHPMRNFKNWRIYFMKHNWDFFNVPNIIEQGDQSMVWWVFPLNIVFYFCDFLRFENSRLGAVNFDKKKSFRWKNYLKKSQLKLLHTLTPWEQSCMFTQTFWWFHIFSIPK